MSEARIDSLSNESNTGGPTLSGITTFSGTNYFVPPVGSTLERPQNPQKGALRFNTDTYHLEYYRGDTIGWTDIEASHGQLGGSNTSLGTPESAGSNAGVGARGLFCGGYSPGDVKLIDFCTISTLGNCQTFGELTVQRRPNNGGASDRTRGVCIGGRNPVGGFNAGTMVDYVTIASTGDALDFGTCSACQNAAVVTSSTRGIRIGGDDLTMEYVTIQSTGTKSDFGDMNDTNSKTMNSGCQSPTRGVFMGGYTNPSPGNDTNTIQYITMASTGDSKDFGDLTVKRRGGGSAGNATRALHAAGRRVPASLTSNITDYITIPTTGNATDFGDMVHSSSNNNGTSSPTRAIFRGGYQADDVDVFEIATTGNAVAFGDLTDARMNTAPLSNAHGGL